MKINVNVNKNEVGFLFDLDGVLINSCEYHWNSWQRLQEETPDFKTNKEEFLVTFGKRNDEIFYEKIPGIEKARVDFLSERKEELFREACRGQIELLPGMENFLQELQRAGIKKIIASSTPKSNLNFFLKETILGKYFSDFIAGDMCPRGKPAPDIFLAAAKRLGLPPASCIVLEDSPAGLRAARAAGTFVIALATTHKKAHLSKEDYDVIYDGPHELCLKNIF